MDRRNMLWAVLSAAGGLFAANRADAATETDPAAAEPKPVRRRFVPRKQKVVYHLSDAERVQFVLGNIQNHLDGVGGPGKIKIALVVHGPALKAFHATAANPDLAGRVETFTKAGLELAACGNTMKVQQVTLKELLPGFVSAEKGGVVRIAELQSQGYLYLRP